MINNVQLDFINECLKVSDAGFNMKNLPLGLDKIITRGGGKTEMPLFFLAQGYQDCLFLVIRGATEKHDFIRCLNFDPVDFMGGKVHAGAYEAAKWIIEQSRRYIDQWCGRIIVVGHSLGAATGSTVAAILRLQERRENVTAIIAASFPVFSSNIQKLTEPFITSFVYNNDVVPKLSLKNVKALLPMLSSMGGAQSQQSVEEVIVQTLQTILMQRGIYVERSSLLETVSRQIALIKQQQVTTDLFCPGTVSHVKLNLQNQTYDIIPFKDGEPIQSIMSVLIGVQDHSLQLLIAALDKIINQKQNYGPVDIDNLD